MCIEAQTVFLHHYNLQVYPHVRIKCLSQRRLSPVNDSLVFFRMWLQSHVYSTSVLLPSLPNSDDIKPFRALKSQGFNVGASLRCRVFKSLSVGQCCVMRRQSVQVSSPFSGQLFSWRTAPLMAAASWAELPGLLLGFSRCEVSLHWLYRGVTVARRSLCIQQSPLPRTRKHFGKKTATRGNNICTRNTLHHLQQLLLPREASLRQPASPDTASPYLPHYCCKCSVGKDL